MFFSSILANTYSFSVDTSELAPGLVLGQVQAKDRDAGINGIVRYRIRTMDSQDPEDPFHYFGNYLFKNYCHKNVINCNKSAINDFFKISRY